MKDITAIGELISLLHSKSFLALLEERKNFLQGEVNKFVRAKDLIEAYGALMRKEDVDKTVEMMTKRLQELQKEE